MSTHESDVCLRALANLISDWSQKQKKKDKVMIICDKLSVIFEYCG